ncbi:class I SAM-dependent methyltransferase [Candidatus Bipolaricaulota bacterium]
MHPTILRANATAVYRFLSILNSSLDPGESLRGKKILDCGAGGPIPPLAIFAEQGMDTHGIDISEKQIEKSSEFIDKTCLPIHLQVGDMRRLPYDNGAFDYVYEHYSMCHLSKLDTAVAIGEMQRILKPGGIAFLGVVSQDCWPLSSYGEERSPGERWMIEGGEERCHSLFADAEADQLLSAWDVASKEKAISYVGGEQLSEAEWEVLHTEAPVACSLGDWMQQYSQRPNLCRYVHIYYYLVKPEI